jgi:predicted alternative tryptophan synthase beta-subunit
MSRHKIVLDEDSLPTHWYNLGADLPLPAPPLHPGTLQPVGPEDLAPLFPMSIILQEVSGEAQHEIPEEVRQAYRIWRPTPLMRAERFERALGLKGVRIYYKYEGGSPSGSHKPTARRTAAGASPPRPAPASGARRSPTRHSCTGSSARSSWSASRTARSRTGA